ncbi:SET and MYND domain-containing protein 4-like isoform X1 [Macrobrachium rosenbergii]|uniref:SET and MYND domain-containing protein 4-like isoform X1 n=1 Tax=Macrobrachium rosenbergii TaxID=79674 RepID=UPI0034D46B02
MAFFNFVESLNLMELLLSDLALVRYRGKKDVDEILRWAWDNYHFDCNALEPSVKSEDEAERLRCGGDLHFLMKNYERALTLYNLSIMAAPHPVLSNEKIEESEDNTTEFAFPRIDPARYGGVPLERCSALGKGFASRSAFMFEFGEYEKCLQDIDLALEYGCPEELRPQIEERRLKCQAAQRQVGRSDYKKKSVAADNPFSLFLRESMKERLSISYLKPPALIEPNPSIPALSSAAKVSHWPDKGRGLIATRDIKPGEVVCLERAYAVGLGRGQLTTHCSACTRQCSNPLPCPGCTQVVFCSKSCRTRGLSEDHWLECKILASVLDHNLESRACSYKLLKTFNFSQMKSICSKLKADKPSLPEQLGFDSTGKYSSSSFQSVYHLHQDLNRDSLEDLVSECLHAFRLTKFMELSERYFVDDTGKPVTVTKEDFLETCKILVNNFAKSAENSFGVAGQKMAAFKVFLAKSLINHSCCPVMSHSSFGRESFVYAMRPISSGEELTISYTDYFNIEPKITRNERLLRNRGFVCRCQACEENWPTTVYLPEIVLLCENCSKPQTNVGMWCNDCLRKTRSRNAVANKVSKRKQSSQKVAPALRVLHRMEGKIRTGKPISKEEFRRLCEASEVAFKHSAMPSRTLVNFMGSVEFCADAGLL